MKKVPATDLQALASGLASRFEDQKGFKVLEQFDELTLRLPPEELVATSRLLRDDPAFKFDQLIDLCGVDYSEYGSGYDGLFTMDAQRPARFSKSDDVGNVRRRFAVVVHLLSTSFNMRVRLRAFLEDAEVPLCPTLTEVWPVAEWYEREAFDLFGIVFEGHPDLRRLLTDYGFIGHPFRKDFPIYGKVEMRYDPDKERVIYVPVSIKPREVVPRIRRRNTEEGV